MSISWLTVLKHKEDKWFVCVYVSTYAFKESKSVDTWAVEEKTMNCKGEKKIFLRDKISEIKEKFGGEMKKEIKWDWTLIFLLTCIKFYIHNMKTYWLHYDFIF